MRAAEQVRRRAHQMRAAYQKLKRKKWPCIAHEHLPPSMWSWSNETVTECAIARSLCGRRCEEEM